MATKDYNFQYVPLTGKLPGNSFVKQTEQAINELAGIVNEGSAQVEVITNLANTANDNAEEALEKANEALNTASRVYITLPNLDDADDYFDSQLYYFANSYSANLPVQDTGFLEVKTNDTKTACEQVFIADDTGLCYFRHGIITSAEVGSETVYSVTWDIWSSALASEDYVQQEVNTGIGAANDYTDEQIKQHGNLPVGHEYFSMNPNIPQGSLPLIGGVYSRETYADLWAWVQTQSGYLKTEAEWQALSTANNGNVPFYSSGDGSTTFRVPSLHCWIKGSDGSAQLVGSYLQAGLPNISGDTNSVGWNGSSDPNGGANGAFSGSAKWSNSWALNGDPTPTTVGLIINFDASLSNSIYGNANTVQPESIVGMWLVKCYGTVADTGTIDEKAYMDEQLALNVPVGCVQAYAGQTTPQGWLLCDGSAISRTQYSKLFGVIGTSYGAGDGSTTFNLPDLVDKFVQGSATSGTEKSAGLPNITGKIKGIYGYNETGTGAWNVAPTIRSSEYSVSVGGGNVFSDRDIDASKANPIYGNSNTVQPPSVTMRYIIKY